MFTLKLLSLIPKQIILAFYSISRIVIGFGTGAASAQYEGQLIARYLKKRAQFGGKIWVFDVGYNVGDWTKSFIDEITRRKDLKINAFGFDPSFAAANPRVKENFKNTFISLHSIVLSDQEGKADFYLEPSGVFAREFDTKKVEVSTISFESFVSQQNLEFTAEDLVVLKIDTEGSEEKIIIGCGSDLAAIDIVQFEIGEFSRLANSSLKSIMDLLGDGFSLHIISFVYGLVELDLDKLARWDGFDTTNFVAIRKSRFN